MDAVKKADRLLVLLRQIDERLLADGHDLAPLASESRRLAATIAGTLDGVAAMHLENRYLRLAALDPAEDEIPQAPDPALVVRRLAGIAVVDEIRDLVAGAGGRCADVAAVAAVIARHDAALRDVDSQVLNPGRAG